MSDGALGNLIERRARSDRSVSDAMAEDGRMYVRLPRGYRSDIRAAQLHETLAFARLAALVPLLLAAALVPLFWTSPQFAILTRLFAFVAVSAGAAVLVASLGASRIGSARAVEIGRKVAAVFASLVGSAFAAIPMLLFPAASGDQRLLLLGTLAAAMADTCVLGPIYAVGLLFLAPLVAGGVIGLAQTGDAGAVAVAALLLVAGWGLAMRLKRQQALSERRICDRIRVAEQAETMESLLLNVEANGNDWLWDTNVQGRLRHVSDEAARAIGLPREAIENARFRTILDSRGVSAPMSEGARTVRAAMVDRKPFRDVLVEIRTPGASLWWRLTGKPLRDATGAFAGFRGVGADITAARDTEARIAYLANYDSLTGLANRERFKEHAASECKAAAADGHWRALLYLDLDRFKNVNDTLGHAAGDALLKRVALRLTSALPRGALGARLGGDEFAVWYRAKTPAKAEALAGRLIDALGAPFDIDGALVNVGVCIGIAYTPRDSIQPDALLGKADLALYRAKAAGRGTYRAFVEDDELVVVERRKLEHDLKLAIARQEFEVHYQPLVDLSHGEIVSFEALIRWRSETRGFVSPADFIPAAEASGLITAIGRWVLFEACKDAVGWPGGISVAVNVSPQQFRSPGFVQSVMLALKQSGLAPPRLELEVTEGLFLDHSAVAIEHLTTLREHGIRIALDDFGTGYSSLSYLTNFPVDKIKIDRSFIRDFTTRHENQAIVDAILTLARKLSIRVTAEGVETAEQAVALKLRRCDDIQGFLLSKPRPNADMADMLARVPVSLRESLPKGFVSPLALALASKRKLA